VQYPAIDIEAKGFAWDGKGAFPTPTLRISNVGGLVSSAVITLKDLVGATVTRIRTLAEHLDGGSEPDSGKYFPLDIFTVEQKTKANNIFVEWRLSSVLDAADVQLPGRPILRDVCTRQYRIYDSLTDTFDYSLADCPYSGSRFYNENDREVNTKSADNCSKRITGCKARFGKRAELPTWAFPGVAIVI
jgi:lambda family phage minor tail protein L